jgi:hypothetical protein
MRAALQLLRWKDAWRMEGCWGLLRPHKEAGKRESRLLVAERRRELLRDGLEVLEAGIGLGNRGKWLKRN